MAAEIEIRKHKLMFCFLLRGGVVSALFRICSFIAMKCVYIVFFLLSVFWFQLALISSDCFESFFQSVKYGSIVCRRKFHEKGIKCETFHYGTRSSSMAQWLCEVESTRRYRVQILLRTFFIPSSFFFFSFVLFCLLICFAGFFLCFFVFLLLNIYLNNC